MKTRAVLVAALAALSLSLLAGCASPVTVSGMTDRLAPKAGSPYAGKMYIRSVSGEKHANTAGRGSAITNDGFRAALADSLSHAQLLSTSDRNKRYAVTVRLDNNRSIHPGFVHHTVKDDLKVHYIVEDLRGGHVVMDKTVTTKTSVQFAAWKGPVGGAKAEKDVREEAARRNIRKFVRMLP